MSLLSRYYYRRYMLRTLEERNTNETGLNNIKQEVNEIRSVLSTFNETYESATSGFFASAGEVIQNYQ